MLVTSLNIVKPYAGWGWAGGYFWYLKEVMVASGRFTVRGSGDGLARFAYNGVTAALSGPDQGSGGAYDCLQNPKFTDATVKQNGYWNAGGWCVLDEVGSNRQYLFSNTAQTSAGWDGYGRIAYNPGGGATPTFVGAAVTATAIPTAATNEQWLYGTRAAPDGAAVTLYATTGYVHVFCEDTTELGVTAFGFIACSDARVVGGLVACPVVNGPTWDVEPVVFFYGSSFGQISTFNQFGGVNQAWTNVTVNRRNIYNGGTAGRYTNGSATVLQMICTSGSGANAYIKGFLGQEVGCTIAKWTYPTLVQDDGGNRWIPAAGGLMFRWIESNPVTLPR